MDAALLSLKQLASLMGVSHDDDHQDEVKCVENDRNEKLHSFDVDGDVEGRVDQVDGAHHECDGAEVLPG